MRRWLAICLAACCGLAFAQSEEVAKPDPVVEARLKALAEELRCLVCQNQTIADSNAPLAHDLRNEIRVQVAQGKTDDQIRDYMVQRYGDFVLYRPPWKAVTLLLWIGPFALLALGVFVFMRMTRRRVPAAQDESVPRRSRAEVESLLGKD
jgi:cytochrome c-type biogenesis protein CcmH